MPAVFDDCKIVNESDDALLVLIPDIDDDPVWVPRSQVHPHSEITKLGESGEFAVTKWLAQKRGW